MLASLVGNVGPSCCYVGLCSAHGDPCWTERTEKWELERRIFWWSVPYPGAMLAHLGVVLAYLGAIWAHLGMLKSTKSLWSWCMKQCFPTRCAPTQLWVVGCFQANLQARCAFWGSKTYSLGICRGWNVCPPNNLYPGSFEFLLADEQPQFHVFHIHRSCTWVICVK